MKTKFKFYIALFITLFVLNSCENNSSYSPNLPIRSAGTPQTVLMYFPYSSNLTHGFFPDDIDEVKNSVAKGHLGRGKILIFFETKKFNSTITELYHEDGVCKERLHATYTDLDITKAENIAAVWQKVIDVAPANKYAMTIGAHGLAWVPPLAPLGTKTFGVEVEPSEYSYPSGVVTRDFGDRLGRYSTDVATLANGIALADIKLEYLLLDLCYMSSVEVAYDLREVIKYLVASPCEIMGDGFPYHLIIQRMFANEGAAYDLQGICDDFYNFYSSNAFPYGAIAVTVSSELEQLAKVMKDINQNSPRRPNPESIQVYDGSSPSRFYDLGDYVNKLCEENNLTSLYEEFKVQLDRAVPIESRRQTGYYFANLSNIFNGTKIFPIDENAYTGIMTSDLSDHTDAVEKENTAWYKVTH